MTGEGQADLLGRGSPPAPVGRPRRLTLPGSGSAPARQVDGTTCGSAVLSMLAMAGEPRIAGWVAEEPGPRFDGLQLRVHQASSRAGLVPWPQRFGTAPWAAARLARYGGVRYGHRVLGVGERRRALLREAVAAASAGVPVPLYTGPGFVPRHVVLLVDAPSDDVVRIYEPSSATLHTVPVATLLDPLAAGAEDRKVLTAALGGWPDLLWALLPRR